MPWPWEKLFGTKPSKQEEPRDTLKEVLPSDVRYALAHRGARLNQEELGMLVRDGARERTEFANVALYLLLKALSDDPESEERVIQTLVRRLAEEKPESEDMVRNIVRAIVEEELTASRAEKPLEVDARNIAGISRRGFSETDARLEQTATRYAKDTRRVVIVGHAMFVGLGSFVNEFRKANRPLHVIIPKFLPEEGSEGGSASSRNFPSGFVIEPNGLVRELRTEDLRPEHGLVVVDDVKRKGDTERKIGDYLKGLDAPAFDFEPMLDASEAPSV